MRRQICPRHLERASQTCECSFECHLKARWSNLILLEWLSWLKNHPPQNISGITVSQERYLRFEALYNSDSLLLLVSMPVTLWNAMPQRTVYPLLLFLLHRGFSVIGRNSSTELVSFYQFLELFHIYRSENEIKLINLRVSNHI
jgi:hypothetical protein